MQTQWSKLTTAVTLVVALVLGGCNPSGLESMEQDPWSESGTMYQALVAPTKYDTAAQRGVDFVVDDAVKWAQVNKSDTVNTTAACAACHRTGAVLQGASLAAYTGYSVKLGSTDGLGYLADQLIATQEATGEWHHGSKGERLHPLVKSGWSLVGLAGHTQYVSNLYFSNLKRGIDYARNNTSLMATFTTPLDGKLVQGTTSYAIPQTASYYPINKNWLEPTAQYAMATRALLNMGVGLSKSEREAYEGFLAHMVNSLEGQYVRTAAGSWSADDIAYALIGTIQDPARLGRTSVSSMKSDLLNLALTTGGWSDPQLDGTNVYTTGISLYALCLAGERADSPKVAAALNWLADKQCTASNNYCSTGKATLNGSWPEMKAPYKEYWVTNGYPDGRRPLGDVPPTFATLALGCFGSFGVQVTQSSTGTTFNPNVSTPQTVTFNVNVKNTGYLPNTYRLDISGGSQGFEASHNNPSLSLAPGASGTDTVTIRAPANLAPSDFIRYTVTVSYATKNGMVNTPVDYFITVPTLPTCCTATTVTILSPSNGTTVAPGSRVTLTARVNQASGGALVTQGTVSFSTLGAAITNVRANASGLYTFDWQVPASTTLLGAQEFTASYNGYAAPGSTTGLMPSSASGRMTIAFPNGAVCNGQKDCASGNCVDGVCCNSACGGSNTRDCQACSRIAGATTDGTCGTVRAGFSCRQSLGYCDSPEVCDGSNTACPGDTVTTNGTTCTAGAGSCSNGQCVSPSRGLRANYFNNITLEGTPVYRPTNSTMDFNWGTGSPDPINNTVTVDNFSARWMGDIFTPENPANEVGKYDGLYTFETLSDEGVKLWVDGKQIINNWTSHLETTDRGSIRLEAGKRYSVVLEYFEGQQNARLKLSWQPPSTTTMQVLATPAAPAAATLTPAVNNVLPVRIKSPLDRTTYTANATINIDVETIGLGSTISKVEFFQDGSTTPFSTDTTAPYSAQRTGLAPGVYVFTARTTAVATTTTGNVTLVQNSAPVAVTVIAAPTTTSNNSGQGLTADYYDGVGFNLSNFMFTRSEQVPGPDYSANPVPADVVRPNAFSVRLTGTVVPVYSQAYTFLLQTSGSAKVYINNQTTPIIDSATGLKSLPITGLTAGQLVPIRIEYSHNSATVLPLLKLSWESSSEPTSVIPTSRLYPAIQSSR